MVLEYLIETLTVLAFFLYAVRLLTLKRVSSFHMEMFVIVFFILVFSTAHVITHYFFLVIPHVELHEIAAYFYALAGALAAYVLWRRHNLACRFC